MYFFIPRIFFSILTLALFSFFGNTVFGSEISVIHNILKIKTYVSDPNGSFIFSSYGSAIAISPTRILTNAHVILDTNGDPTWLYEICFSDTFEKIPECRDTARLIAYDTVADLAILELNITKSLQSFSFATAKLAIGSYVSMYGYPGIGGETITRTDWKIAGFEQFMYKIDGSIDHGNSGWWAFNNSWELVGMPTAVASDNASIGYMIPVVRIQEFLSKKTNNYDIYTREQNQLFVEFIHRNQAYLTSRPFYQWNDLIVRNPYPYGFGLKNTMISSDNTMIQWLFSDKYERVKFMISCTNDAGWLLSWQTRLAGFDAEKKQYPTWNMFYNNEDKYLTVYSSNKWYRSSILLYYKDYDACFADIEYQDIKKDMKSLGKSLQFLRRGVSFRGSYSLKQSESNQYFVIKNTPESIRVIRSIDLTGNESIVLGLELLDWNWVNSEIEGKKYPTLQDLGTALDVDFDEIKTWSQYIAFGIKSGVDPSRIQKISLGENHFWLLYSLYNTEKKTTKIVFEYTYLTPENTYGYWNWSGTMNGDFIPDSKKFETFFKYFSFPGQSFLL
jgi:hypothetical protein